MGDLRTCVLMMLYVSSYWCICFLLLIYIFPGLSCHVRPDVSRRQTEARPQITVCHASHFLKKIIQKNQPDVKPDVNENPKQVRLILSFLYHTKNNDAICGNNPHARENGVENVCVPVTIQLATCEISEGFRITQCPAEVKRTSRVTKKIKTLLECSPYPLCLFTFNRQLITCNPAAVTVFGETS